MTKGLIFVLSAVLSAGLLFIGCSQGSDSGTTTQVIGGRLVDITVDSQADLATALENPDFQVIGVTTAIALTGTSPTIPEIPAGKTVVLYASLTPHTTGLEVKGTLVVEGSGVLVADATHRVRVTDGFIEVINGTIQVDSVVDIHGQDIQIQILGTSKAYFADGTLDIQDPLKTLDDVKTAFSWVPKGTLLVDSVTEAIKPSDLVLIPTTSIRRLTITDALVTAVPTDTATSLVVPVGMTFETEDPLTYLKSLEVKGSLTADLALLDRVESLAVTGELSAAIATYDNVTSLVVGSPFTSTNIFPKLESLTVNKGGAFTGANATGSPDGITITVDTEGSASVAAITKLKTSRISGTLTSPGFIPEAADTTLTAAAGATINGVTFPAETAITSLALNTVTIGDYTIPEDTELSLAGTSTLIIPTGRVLTIAPLGAKTSGTGVIKALGTTLGGTITINNVPDYTTEAAGVTGANLVTAIAAFAADTAKLTNNPGIDLKTTFFALGPDEHYYGIGSVSITAVSATAVKDGADGATGTAITLDTNSDIDGTITYAVTGTDTLTGATTLTAASGALSITDAWATGTPKVAILTVTGVKLKNNGLLSPVILPPFRIGIKTARA
jgi:hypothetical protein